MQQNQLKGSLMLFFCALIWGLAFVAQSVGADHVGPFTFNGIRSLIGAAFLIPCVAFFDHLAGKPLSIWGTDNKTERQDLITGGIICGIVLTVASTLQQLGIGYTTVGKTGFITTLYIVIVPLLAPLGPPETGASMNVIPLDLSSVWILRLTSAVEVVVSTMIKPS